MRLSATLKPTRQTNVILRSDLDGMLLIKDRIGDKDFRLNASAAYIWQLCDGKQSISQISARIQRLGTRCDTSIGVEVSDTLSLLFSQGLLDFNFKKIKPFAKINFAISGLSSNELVDYFMNLFGHWFDLQVVTVNETADVYVNIGDIQADASSASLQVYVTDNYAPPDREYDLIFASIKQAEPTNQIEDLSEDLILIPENKAEDAFNELCSVDQEKIIDLLGQPQSTSIIDSQRSSLAPLPKRSEKKKKLTIGMATYDDYDGVYFSVQAIRMYHPEVTDETEILVIDNNPGGVCAEALRSLESTIPGYRYLAVDHITGTAVRDYIYREANSDYVMCIDSHVFVVPGAIRKLIDYFELYPDSPDLLQGPLVMDDLVNLNTHFEPAWREGMFGFWSMDKRGKDIDGEPFDIPMQGLGLSACRKSAWQGYNPRFRGFGGEEGYIHQKFRNAGARTLCLPFLRWVHRFSRPMGVNYSNKWDDRIRNYLIGFEEVGLNIELMLTHFRDVTSPEMVNSVVHQLEKENNNPFNFFDAIYCINLDSQPQRWEEVKSRFDNLGISHRVERFSAIETPESHHIGCTLSHRRIVELAKSKKLRNILVFEDDVIFHDDTLLNLQNSLLELDSQRWNVFYLGGMKWMKLGKEPFEKIQGCQYLERPEKMTCTHAVAYHSNFYDTLLNEVPATEEGVTNWIKKEYPAIDQYLPTQEGLVVMAPVVASQASIQKDEEESMRDAFR